MPPDILASLEAGCFTVSITDQAFYDVAFDEAHEIIINKDLEWAIVRPSCEHLSQMSLFYQHRAACLYNLTCQVLPTKEPTIKGQEGTRKRQQSGGSNKGRRVTKIINIVKLIQRKRSRWRPSRSAHISWCRTERIWTVCDTYLHSGSIEQADVTPAQAENIFHSESD